MAGYIGTKAVLLSTTAATVTGDMTVGGAATISGATTVTGAFTSLGIDDNAAATAMTLDASGNVGIGTAAPASLLDVEYGSGNTYPASSVVGPIFSDKTASENFGLNIFSDNASNASINFGDEQLANVGRIVYDHNGNANTMAFYTSAAERMRIDSSGRLLVGTTSKIGGTSNAPFQVVSSGSAALVLSRTDANTTLAAWTNTTGTTVGTITVTASATAYNTSSDYRLKENITPVQGAADIVKAMQPVTYTFKSDGSWHDGFLAHELQELHPRAVIGEKDAMVDEEYEVTPAVLDDDGNVVAEAVMGTRSVPDYQGVDYSKLTPILTAALQEALNKIDALEARLTALEAV